ncbi:MAG: acetyltransferase-like isoleucine patch superfamily enzyme [Flammeovirgaceae bacterium]|jgi:acetyltransferase-like isoleucine patch superfamily enzyme
MNFLRPIVQPKSGVSVKIGNHVLVAHNVNIIDTNSHHIDYMDRARAFEDLLSVGPAKENTGIVCKPIVIEDNAWINFNSTILKGVRIGKGAIIGPNSVVLDDVPPFCFYAGNPAKFIKKIN